MSVYNAIANIGSNTGAGLNAFAQNRYKIQQDQQTREMQADQNAFTKQQAMAKEFQYAAQLGPEAGMQHLRMFAQRFGVEQPGDDVVPYLEKAHEAFTRSNQPAPKAPTFREFKEGDNVVTYEIGDDGSRTEVARGPRQTPSTNVSVNVGADGAPSHMTEALFKWQSQMFFEAQERARGARALLPQIEAAKALDVRTGSRADFQLTVRRLARAFNVPVDDSAIASAESFNGVMGRIVNDRVSQEKGPQTDNDVIRFARTMASLDKLEDSNRFLLEYAGALAMRDVEFGEYLRNTVRKQGDFEEALDQWYSGPGAIPMYRTDIQLPGSNSKLPVFYAEFEKVLKKDNPEITKEQIQEAWLRDY
jgi:hypothetical protein